MKSQTNDNSKESPYVPPKILTERWECSHSTDDRIAMREGFTRVCLGTGKNGIVRYLRKEVDAYEETRRVTLKG
jgi:hypothetical protein